MAESTKSTSHDKNDVSSCDTENRLSLVEKAVAELKKKPKDNWDIVQILAAAFVPIAIVVVGTLFSINTKKSEIAVAETNAKVAQAKLVHSFMETLTSENPQKRKIAVGAILLALPDDGEALLNTVRESDPDAGVRAFASEQLGVSDLYAQLSFRFDSYEGRTIPPDLLFADGGELSIGVSDRPIEGAGWKSLLRKSIFKVLLSSSIQITNRQSQPTVDGTTVTQTNTFERFSGDLGIYASANSWKDATVAAVFRINARDDWLRSEAARDNSISLEDFTAFYGIPEDTVKEWSESDYAVTPILPVSLEVYLGSSKILWREGIIAHVWEHDEDVRNLHVAYFAPRRSQ